MNIEQALEAMTGNPVAHYVFAHAWVWPLCEVLHFMGLAVVLGTIGCFDLRVLGLARGVPYDSLHRYVRWGAVGFAVNASTGAVFFAALPAQYVYNAAFELKLLCLALLGLNLICFYALAWRRVMALRADEPAPWPARIAAAISLLLLIAVVCFGRFVAFYKYAPLEL